MSLKRPVHRPDDGLDQSDQLVRSDRAPSPSRASASARSQNGVDRYGLVALLVAACGLGAVLVLQARSGVEANAPEAPGHSTQSPVVLAAPPVRDQWYLDERRSAPPSAAAPALPQVRDQWYLDSPQSASSTQASAVPPARDTWYLDDSRSLTPTVAMPVVPPVRDQWYLDQGSPGATMAPGQIVNAYLAAQTAGDAEGALNLLADNAVLEAAPPDVCAPPNPCLGKHDIETYFLTRVLSGHPNLTPVEQVADGGVVTTRVEVRNDGVRMAGFDRYIVNATARISGGKILNFKVVRDLDDPETAAFNNWQVAHR